MSEPAIVTSELMEEVRRLKIRAGRRVTDLLAGEYHSAFKGQGIEFAEVREYEPGDDVRTIDWNVTARAGKPFIKRFDEERQLTVAMLVDGSASGAFGSGARLKARVIAEACAIVAIAALRNNDRVGLMRFSDAVDLFVPPRKGSRHLLRVLRELLGAAPAGGGAAFAEAIRTLGRLLHQRSTVFIASDFLPPPGRGDLREIETPLRLLARRHEVIALRIRDPRESTLPPVGLITLVDPETGRTTLFDAGSARARRALSAASERAASATASMLRRCGVDVVEIGADRSPGESLERYFRMRERRRTR